MTSLPPITRLNCTSAWLRQPTEDKTSINSTLRCLMYHVSAACDVGVVISQLTANWRHSWSSTRCHLVKSVVLQRSLCQNSISAMYIQHRTTCGLSQAARQGLAVLMASAVVVLTHETSTLRLRHNFISMISN